MWDLLIRLVTAALSEPDVPAAPRGSRRRMMRQGDVLLLEVGALPPGTKPVARVSGDRGDRIVLAYGEVTGHAHAIEETHVEARERGGRMYLRIDAPATLRHEEHAPLELPAGHYEVRRQREYAPESPAPRPVED